VKIALFMVLAIAALLLLVELGLRLFLGFGNPLLYLADDQIGYLLAPNQDVRRFGHRIMVNAYSMRSPAISPARSPDSLRVFLIGDSVANGGWWTDQADTISTLMQQQLSTAALGIAQVEVLNASANSWGPRNELAYLKRFGTFDAQVVVLLLNTDDLFATTPTSVQVGRDRNYPNRKPPLALIEVISRYILPPVKIPELETIQAEKGDRVGINLAAIQQIKTLLQASQAHLVVGLTPLLRETGTTGPRDYEVKARQRLHTFTEQETIPYVDFLPIFNTASDVKTLYHDHIHLSPLGNRTVSEQLVNALKPHVINNPSNQ
jgi:GDSL-like Lipase/Acylhydrolase family